MASGIFFSSRYNEPIFRTSSYESKDCLTLTRSTAFLNLARRITLNTKSIAVVLLSAACLTTAFSEHCSAFQSAIFRETAITHPEIGYRGMAATQDANATRAAVKVLADGGNAVDAAVTTGFVLAVTLPRAGNIGGGGFMMVHDAKTNTQTAIDYREQASAQASRDMFLGEDGLPIKDLSRVTHLAAGVPGTVRGMAHALEKYGTISLADALAPAIKLAENGFIVTEDLHDSLIQYRRDFESSEAAMRVFYRQDRTAWPVGSLLIQRDLAKTLRAIAQHGADEFYEGGLAKVIAKDMADNGGIISTADLSSYRVVERLPVTGSYRGLKIVSMPPPSSGGVHLIQMLNILEHFPLAEMGHNSAESIHVMAEAMRLAYADRSQFLGDPDFVEIPVQKITSKAYAKRLAQKIDRAAASDSLKVVPGQELNLPRESNETTHFSIVDRFGNAVSNTYTLNFSYGSKLMVPGTGILLNNQMDDFSAKPGTPNGYGLIGGRFNAIEPGKRMLSSMTPTFIFRQDGTLVATGSPGGSRIINVLLQMVVNISDFKMSISEATMSPRFHHQWLPDVLRLEQGFSVDSIRLLQAKGHKIEVKPAMGSTQTVSYDGRFFRGYSDTRRRNSLALGVAAEVEQRKPTERRLQKADSVLTE
jgi:gamma-glutamyltranspeptidase/glutathione hydrolase